jgi:predicted MFS family arabinose efflux permease
MLQSIVFLVLVATGRITFAQIVALTLFLGVVDTLNLTARHALVPLLVPPQELQAGVALNSAGMNLTQVIGPSLGGLMLGLVGVSGCLAINAVSFVAILGAIRAMRWRPTPGVRPRSSVGDEWSEGIRYVRARANLWVPVCVAYGVAAFAMAYSRILPVFATDMLHAGVRAYGWMLAAPGLGALVASLWVASREREHARRRMFKSVALVVLALCAFAMSHNIWLSLLALVFVGAGQMTFRTTALALVHRATDDAHRGRVMSIFLLDYGFWSFGTLWLGFLCDAYGATVAVMTGALTTLVITAAVALVARPRPALARVPTTRD